MLGESRVLHPDVNYATYSGLISLLPLGEGLGMRAQAVEPTHECLREMISLVERNHLSRVIE
jgi:hypothetical protein